MPDNKREMLEKLPGWVWNCDALDVSFQVRISALRKFYGRENHIRIPAKHLEDGVDLSTWTGRLRYHYPKLPGYQIKQLEEIPGWVWDPRAERFWKAYREIVKFREVNGNLDIPASHKPDGIKLRNWLWTKRDRRSEALPYQVEALERIPGWSWEKEGLPEEAPVVRELAMLP